MDELDEFNEAPHIVHGDVLLPPSLLSGTGVEPSDNPHYAIINNGDINVSLLDDDEEDIVLSTDDLLMGNNHFLTSHHHRDGDGDNLLHISSDLVSTSKNMLA